MALSFNNENLTRLQKALRAYYEHIAKQKDAQKKRKQLALLDMTLLLALGDEPNLDDAKQVFAKFKMPSFLLTSLSKEGKELRSALQTINPNLKSKVEFINPFATTSKGKATKVELTNPIAEALTKKKPVTTDSMAILKRICDTYEDPFNIIGNPLLARENFIAISGIGIDDIANFAIAYPQHAMKLFKRNLGAEKFARNLRKELADFENKEFKSGGLIAMLIVKGSPVLRKAIHKSELLQSHHVQGKGLNTRLMDLLADVDKIDIDITSGEKAPNVLLEFLEKYKKDKNFKEILKWILKGNYFASKEFKDACIENPDIIIRWYNVLPIGVTLKPLDQNSLKTALEDPSISQGIIEKLKSEKSGRIKKLIDGLAENLGVKPNLDADYKRLAVQLLEDDTLADKYFRQLDVGNNIGEITDLQWQLISQAPKLNEKMILLLVKKPGLLSTLLLKVLMEANPKYGGKDNDFVAFINGIVNSPTFNKLTEPVPALLNIFGAMYVKKPKAPAVLNEINQIVNQKYIFVTEADKQGYIERFETGIFVLERLKDAINRLYKQDDGFINSDLIRNIAKVIGITGEVKNMDGLLKAIDSHVEKVRKYAELHQIGEVRSNKEIKANQSDPILDLRKFPSKDLIKELRKDQALIIGDLHGNALKLIYTLLIKGVIAMKPDDYHELVDIYYEIPALLDKKKLDRFNEIIGNIKVLKPDADVRLIGDIMSDRGSNDYFVFKALQKLMPSKRDTADKKKAKLNIKITWSNHDFFFMQMLENLGTERFKKVGFKDELVLSTSNLHYLISKGLVDKKEIIQIFQETYKPALQLIFYDESDETNKDFTAAHAPIGLDSVRDLIDHLNNKYGAKIKLDQKHLGGTYDEINKFFRDNFDKIINDMTIPPDMMTPELRKKYIIESFLFNRSFDDKLERPARSADGKQHVYGYGHEPGDKDPLKSELYVHRYDNNFGSSEVATTSLYSSSGIAVIDKKTFDRVNVYNPARIDKKAAPIAKFKPADLQRLVQDEIRNLMLIQAGMSHDDKYQGQIEFIIEALHEIHAMLGNNEEVKLKFNEITKKYNEDSDSFGQTKANVLAALIRVRGPLEAYAEYLKQPREAPKRKLPKEAKKRAGAAGKQQPEEQPAESKRKSPRTAAKRAAEEGAARDKALLKAFEEREQNKKDIAKADKLVRQGKSEFSEVPPDIKEEESSSEEESVALSIIETKPNQFLNKALILFKKTKHHQGLIAEADMPKNSIGENIRFMIEYSAYLTITDEKQLHTKFNELYDKFLKVGSEYELNLESQLRTKCDNVNDSYNSKDAAQVLLRTANEVAKLVVGGRTTDPTDLPLLYKLNRDYEASQLVTTAAKKEKSTSPKLPASLARFFKPTSKEKAKSVKTKQNGKSKAIQVDENSAPKKIK